MRKSKTFKFYEAAQETLKVYLFGTGIFLFLISCSGTSKTQNAQLEVPMEMPEICRGIDFNLNVEMREMCGVKVRGFRSYKNISQYRLLSEPKDGKIVKKGNKYELRLPDMVPVSLPSFFSGKIDFNENARRKHLNSSCEYGEFLPRRSSKRVKIIRISIPLNNGIRQSVCYAIRPKSNDVNKVQTGYANQLELLACSDFERLKK